MENISKRVKVWGFLVKFPFFFFYEIIKKSRGNEKCQTYSFIPSHFLKLDFLCTLKCCKNSILHPLPKWLSLVNSVSAVGGPCAGDFTGEVGGGWVWTLSHKCVGDPKQEPPISSKKLRFEYGENSAFWILSEKINMTWPYSK